MEISEDLRCVFSAEVEERDGSYVVEVPKRELRLDSIRSDEVYRVAVLASHANGANATNPAGDEADQTDDYGGSTADQVSKDPASKSEPTGDRDGSTVVDSSSDETSSRDEGTNSTAVAGSSSEPEPPVDRGDEVTVDIEGIGDQGDGIARVDRGYVIIVPDTEKGERVRIRVTSVKQNVAFAEVVERIERHHYE